MTKILFTDMDGTLLNASVHISNRTIETIKNFVNEGGQFVPTSGRPIKSICEIMEKYGLMPYISYMIAYNGALIWDSKKGAPLHSWNVTLPQVRAIETCSKELGIHVQSYEDEHILTAVNDPEIQKYTSKIHLPVIYTDSLADTLKKDPYKVLSIHLSDHDLLCKLRDVVEAELPGELSIQFSNPTLLEFYNKDAGKGNAVIKLCKLLDIDISDSYAAGDEENDISMLEAAGCGIAMLNASDAVKSKANVITRYTNDDDGLADFIENNILNM